jgi:hypothetical protein
MAVSDKEDDGIDYYNDQVEEDELLETLKIKTNMFI